MSNNTELSVIYILTFTPRLLLLPACSPPALTPTYPGQGLINRAFIHIYLQMICLQPPKSWPVLASL